MVAAQTGHSCAQPPASPVAAGQAAQTPVGATAAVRVRVAAAQAAALGSGLRRSKEAAGEAHRSSDRSTCRESVSDDGRYGAEGS